MPVLSSTLTFVRLTGYQTQPIPGTSYSYTIDADRPIGYTQPSKRLFPSLPGGGIWRATRRDSSIPVDQLVPLDLGVYNQLTDAQQACQNDATANQLNWTLAWILGLAYQSRAVQRYSWQYSISQPSPDVTGTMYWQAAKRDETGDVAFQTTIPLGNFTDVASAMAACQNDWAQTFPTNTNPVPPNAAPPALTLPTPPLT